MRPGDHAEDFFPISSHLLLALWLLRLAHQQPQIYSGRSFRYPENTAQQRARRYRPNAAGWTPLGWSEKNRKVAISGVLPRSGLGWLSSRDRGVLPTFFPVNCWHNTILSCTVDEYYRSRSVTEILIESVRKRKLTEDSH